MKRVIMSLALLLLAGSLLANETITFTNIYSVGGGTDKAFTSLIPSLERQGFTVTKNFVKSCVDGINLVSNHPANHLLGISTGDAVFLIGARTGCGALRLIQCE